MISVVVPTHRRPAGLAACLRALGRQEAVEGGIEVVVADDGGDADRAAAAEALGPGKPLTFVSSPGAGPAAARNAGAAAASGELLAFTDDDCEPSTGWAAALLRRHRTAPDALIGGRTVTALGANPYSRAAQAISEAAVAHHGSGPGGPRFFPSNNMAVPADRFAELGGFDADLRTSEDRDLCDRWAERGWPLVGEPGALVRHSNPLDLGGFWRQQSAYGAGAFRHRRLRARRGAGLRLEPALTSGLAASALRDALRDRDAGRIALLVVWQAATLAGFAGEAIRSLRRRGAR